MAELISKIQADVNDDSEYSSSEENDEDVETTEAKDIEDFACWTKAQANKDLSNFKSLMNMTGIESLRKNISLLNFQQRRIFDDFMQRIASSDIDENPCYLFIAGEAGTGKSFLVKTLIDAIKFINIKPGADLQKPPLLIMAPTANASYIIGGKTIDSALGFSPADSNRYTSADEGQMAMMKFLYEDVQTLICDEISMVGAKKFAKINYRLQDLADGKDKHKFMGGKSFVAVGIFIHSFAHTFIILH